VQPWSIKDRRSEAFSEAITQCVYFIIGIGYLLKPITPVASGELQRMLSLPFEHWPVNKDTELVRQLYEVRLGEVVNLFQRIELR
jgi:methionyl-tRNA synthetase